MIFINFITIIPVSVASTVIAMTPQSVGGCSGLQHHMSHDVG